MKRDKRVNVQLSETDHRKIKAAAEIDNRSVSDFMRLAAIERAARVSILGRHPRLPVETRHPAPCRTCEHPLSVHHGHHGCVADECTCDGWEPQR